MKTNIVVFFLKNTLYFANEITFASCHIFRYLSIYQRNKMNEVDMFKYLTDIINRTANWQPNTPIEKYRDLFPDRWKKDRLMTNTN
ncbi:hypothetical protein [Bacteroides bouchesdurhonensis]|uniref:hypothetical protein n=1 Tax=Bacteroides bouchesdurhonensis TaxID=1841855 RepID=UPI00097F82F1|nr:hypothetical protein [Bacteroides bouchesdurhonensis]